MVKIAFLLVTALMPVTALRSHAPAFMTAPTTARPARILSPVTSAAKPSPRSWAALSSSSSRLYASIIDTRVEKREEELAAAAAVPPAFPEENAVATVMEFQPNLNLAGMKSEADRQRDMLINGGILAMIGLFVLTKVVTVSIDHWRGWSPTEIFFRMPLDNWDGYMSFLTSYPILTKALTSFTVYMLGDYTAQVSEGKSLADIDRVRVGRSGLAGLVGHGPLSHFWYEICEGFFENVLHVHAWWDFIPKIAVDQLVWSPFWNGVYILLLGLMKREALGDITSQVKTSTVPLIVSGLKLWPAAHIITYGLIPVENRLLWVDFVEVLWVTILSRQAASAGNSKEGEEGGKATTPGH